MSIWPVPSNKGFAVKHSLKPRRVLQESSLSKKLAAVSKKSTGLPVLYGFFVAPATRKHNECPQM